MTWAGTFGVGPRLRSTFSRRSSARECLQWFVMVAGQGLPFQSKESGSMAVWGSLLSAALNRMFLWGKELLMTTAACV